MNVLLVDVGNSRAKAALWNGHALHVLPPSLHGGDAAAVFTNWHIGSPSAVWIAQVMGAASEAPLAAAVQARWRLAPRFARSAEFALGLRSGYAEPARLGIDRWLAMLGAWSRHRGALLVVDAGTALTADAVDAQGQHLGGFIAAGLLTAQQAVLGATRFATRDQSAGYHAGLGRDTEDCVRQGALLASLGAIDRAVQEAPPSARRIITGGDAETLLPYLHGSWEYRPQLVLEGLAALAAAVVV